MPAAASAVPTARPAPAPRQRLPQVVSCAGRTAEGVASAMAAALETQPQVLASHASPEVYAAVRKLVPGTPAAAC